MKIGAHVSATGGIATAIDRILAIGGNCLQIFVSSPRGWAKRAIRDEEVESFKSKLTNAKVGPVFIHGLYLANIATDQAQLREQSIDALSWALTVADRIGAEGVIYHTGSKKDQDHAAAMDNVVSAMQEILANAPGASQLIIEGSAGHIGQVGTTFEELGEMITRVNSDRVKVCFDTCHIFQAGYDLRTTKAIDETLARFNELVGLDRLVVLHANDAKKELGGHLDRHENIGQGTLGESGFRALLHHSKLRTLPWILEVPGVDGNGPDAENVLKLQQLAQ
ncbi:deoxyribonuclease IV [Candidatus Berkelbacteria bacterium]|nr:deoxyribonuclease IV [Candidatus Berkelbacteria bacterium]